MNSFGLVGVALRDTSRAVAYYSSQVVFQEFFEVILQAPPGFRADHIPKMWMLIELYKYNVVCVGCTTYTIWHVLVRFESTFVCLESHLEKRAYVYRVDVCVLFAVASARPAVGTIVFCR